MMLNDLHVATGVLPIDDGQAASVHHSVTVAINDAPSLGNGNDMPNDPKPKDPPKFAIDMNDAPSIGNGNDLPNDPKPKDPPKLVIDMNDAPSMGNGNDAPNDPKPKDPPK